MRLLKLHGSLSWYYSGPGSPASDPVFITFFGGRWGEGFHEINSSDEKNVVDKQHLIVPPTVLKSPYYGNHLLASLWKQAAEALAQAEEVILMGFSLPPSDQLVSSLLVTTVPDEATIVPVNPDREVAERLARLFEGDNPETHTNRVIKAFTGIENPIAEWVQSYAK